MKRKKYQRPVNTRREAEIATVCCDHWGVKMGKLPESYRIDYMAFTDSKGVRGFVEIKDRDMTFGQYQTIMLSLSKWQAGIALAEASKSKFIFVIGTKSGIFYYTYEHTHSVRIEFGGRTSNTRDAEDIEPVVLIPASYFKLLVNL